MIIPLALDLQNEKKTFDEFGDITLRILDYLPNVLSGFEEKSGYRIYISDIAGTRKFIRPINQSLFIADKNDFSEAFTSLKTIFDKIKQKDSSFSQDEKSLIDGTLYTIQQALGAGLDLMVNPNSARKHVGNRFEELIKVIFTEIGVANKKLVLQIPYETEEGTKVYKCENDLILSPFPKS